MINKISVDILIKLANMPESSEILVNTFVYSNFNYCPLAWMLSHKRSLNKIERLHKRALRLLLNDYVSSYE